jgi:hypothetical protein
VPALPAASVTYFLFLVVREPTASTQRDLESIAEGQMKVKSRGRSERHFITAGVGGGGRA